MNLREKKRIRYEVEDGSDLSESDEDYSSTQKNVLSSNSENTIKKLKYTNKIAHNNFTDTKLEILKTEPKIINILETPLLIKDRAKLLQLYEIYKTVTPSTEQWLELRNSVNKLYEECKNNYSQHCMYTKEQHINMSKQLTILEKYDPNIDLLYKILELNTNIYNKQTIFSRYKELKNMSSSDDEKGKLQHWINWAMNIPHDKIKTFPFSKNKLTNFLIYVSKTLDKELYGMKYVKEQILLFVSSKIQNPHMKKCSLGLIGMPGTGKTHISRLLAKILDFPFEQISLGGISNPDFLKGHEYTYVGAQPGEIAKCLKRMKYKNGILFLDEFDKISDNKDICSTLLHITDPIQNSEFRDKFLSDITIDLSYLWFIYSMNELPLDSALKDRIYTIQVPGYKLEDKIRIIIDYLFPKALKNINTIDNAILVSSIVAEYLVKQTINWEKCIGVRTIEKNVNNIVSKIDFIIKHQDKKGKLSGFNMSFDMKKIIKYPLILTIDMIDILK
jgi:ATP-dependent Lon protease